MLPPVFDILGPVIFEPHSRRNVAYILCVYIVSHGGNMKTAVIIINVWNIRNYCKYMKSESNKAKTMHEKKKVYR